MQSEEKKWQPRWLHIPFGAPLPHVETDQEIVPQTISKRLVKDFKCIAPTCLLHSGKKNNYSKFH